MSHRENVTTAAHFKQWCKRSFSFLNSFIYIFFIAFCRYEIIAQFREQCSDNCVLELECGCSIHRPSSSIKFICVFVCAYRTHSANKNEQQQINKQTKNGDNRTASIPSFSGASIKLWRVSVAASEKETENKGNFIYDFVWCRKFSFYVRIMSNKKSVRSECGVAWRRCRNVMRPSNTCPDGIPMKIDRRMSGGGFYCSPVPSSDIPKPN